jgi:cell division protein FtsL
MSSSVSLYRIFKRPALAAGVASVRIVVIAMVVLAITLTTVGVVRVSRQHEVLSLGYKLSKRSDQVKQLEEVRRRLELERATLSAPDRIRRLATQLGMTPVAPDRIRIVTAAPGGEPAGAPVKIAKQP